ncbi:ABC transporter substrate-binding protein [Prauserella sp. PE36]|uniref:MCE family protein n=1 Tax=Prauserella endophytica TaxID=1592324 RepID=A0ABY2RZI4_9PSEU|nr:MULTISPECIES: MCE family protein [Prauserella]PXY24956.1 ABC transporter substrate-binding protein [Prauserella coralliicola]RBM20304.1 ABC transporter substrate-binding protein [Prauserella sp. PE36]TKG66719.1 MCE family protein [Prauserella endophytica]
MTVDTRARRSLYSWLALACVAVLVLATALWWLTREGGTKISAYFDRTVGLYAGSSVRVLGIPVGQITEVRPEGGAVRVDMEVDVPIPEGAGAVVVAPSLVSDRYVQLTPAYDTGPALAAGAVIPRERTATPVELDDLYGSLNELSTSLGPDGANANGALSDVLDTAAANLDGNGKNLNTTVTRLAELATTLESSKGDLFATVRNLQTFTSTLAQSDAQLTEFYDRLAQVTGFLAEDSDDVAAALSALGGSLTEVRQFVQDNRDLLSSNVDKLAGITGVLVDQRAALAEVLDVGPTGMTNFINTYDAASGSIQVRYNANELAHPLMETLCKLVSAGTPAQLPDTLGDLCRGLAPFFDETLDLPSVPETLNALQNGKLPPLPLPVVDLLTTPLETG